MTVVSEPLRLSLVEAYQCPDCGAIIKEINFQRYYQEDDAIYEVRRANLLVGATDWNELFRRKVAEEDRAGCPICGVSSSDEEWSYQTAYACPDCGHYHVESHEALLCCSDGCPGECRCLDGIDWTQVISLVGQCKCSDACCTFVCLSCHMKSGSHRRMVDHVNGTHPDEDPVVPTMTNPNPDCSLCSSEFCCGIHDVHKRPHSGCSLQQGA